MIKYSFLTALIFLSTYSIGQPLDNSQLNFISKSISNKKIIGLGEPDHFYRGYYDLKIQILKFLVKSKSIDAIALEASGVETKKLDTYIKGKDLDISKILPKLNAGYALEGVGLFDCQEILEFLKWLKKENSNRKNKISIFGIDFQNIETPIYNLKFSFPKDEGLFSKLEAMKESLHHLMKQFSTDPMTIYFDSSWKIIARKNYLQAIDVLKYLKKRSHDKSVIQNASELSQFAYIFTDPNLQRDSIMFENFIRQFNPKKKTVIWAHSGHIANDSIVNKFSTMLKLGACLTHTFRSQYFKVTLINAEESKDPESQRINYPIKNNKNIPGKFDMSISCDPGEPAKRLVNQ